MSLSELMYVTAPVDEAYEVDYDDSEYESDEY
jgi:hypothetical protein